MASSRELTLPTVVYVPNYSFFPPTHPTPEINNPRCIPLLLTMGRNSFWNCLYSHIWVPTIPICSPCGYGRLCNSVMPEPRGPRLHKFLAYHLTLFPPAGADSAHPLLLATANLFTFRHHCDYFLCPYLYTNSYYSFHAYFQTRRQFSTSIICSFRNAYDMGSIVLYWHGWEELFVTVDDSR